MTPLPSELGSEAEDFTDADLVAALKPLMAILAPHTPAAELTSNEAQLEPLLRATFRRALAEQPSTQRPFHAARFWDRCCWRLQSLLTNRSFDDILFRKTRRFQVIEAYLFDSRTFAMVSYASSDPARHAAPRSVAADSQRVAYQIRDRNGGVQRCVELSAERSAVSRQGDFAVLTAVIRGVPDEILQADLGFALRRIERRFGLALRTQGVPLLHEIQPFMEECLLIQSPSP